MISVKSLEERPVKDLHCNFGIILVNSCCNFFMSFNYVMMSEENTFWKAINEPSLVFVSFAAKGDTRPARFGAIPIKRKIKEVIRIRKRSQTSCYNKTNTSFCSGSKIRGEFG
jgi:hypothetical protein